MEKLDNTRWQAVVTRNAAYDNIFIYAVKTTGIFCRPVCKARLARRSNVEFFSNAADATTAGYRACKRCRPQLASFTPEADKIRLACEYLQSLPSNSPLPSLDDLARKAGLTKHHFHRLFKREVGVTPRKYGLAVRCGEGRTSEGSKASSPNSVVTSQQYLDQLDATVTGGSGIPSTKLEALEPMIVYTLIDTTFGPLLVTFVDSKINKLELCSSLQEVNAILEATYAGRQCFEIGTGRVGHDYAALQTQIEAIVEALERPSGKMLEMPIFSRG